ncbi:alpha/beta hydrolase [Tardiphaga alba]|uniref:Alpha/beta hydrolase n=1 Tax=Tardiphaga alba TaxID=340268 RepID=A0ABX8A3N1_9BRAD|nr:alpha/beta hydrolase [Tardiphaga alba]QUS38067.1 alpha/beta hydrolase [Tardiphaga alba]
MTAPIPPSSTVVLVHGAWADASSWRRVVAILQAKNVDVVAVQNPTTSLAADVEATRRVIERIDGPVVLAGHSWGGTVITEAGNSPQVKALVFVAAFAPGAGESTGDQVNAHAPPPGLGEVKPDGEGFLKMSVDGWITNVAQDLPAAEARVLAATQPPLGTDTFGDKVTKAAWMDRPNWYIISSEDRAVSVELQRELAVKMKATTVELKASHVSLLSMPTEVAEVILDAIAKTN